VATATDGNPLDLRWSWTNRIDTKLQFHLPPAHRGSQCGPGCSV